MRTINVTVFGAPISLTSDRPYVVKLETNAELIGWGEGTFEGEAGTVIGCINDFQDFLIGAGGNSQAPTAWRFRTSTLGPFA